MVEMGRLNRLKVVKEVDFGLYLEGGELGEILLPSRYIPKDCAIDDEIKVFIYCDSEDRIIATTEKPYVMVGEFACLRVVAVNQVGAFLDWGLPKDLLVPFSEQLSRMEEGKRYVVGAYLDEESKRIAASAKLDEMLYSESEGELEQGAKVNLFVANRSDLGYQVIMNHTYFALLHHHDVVRDLKRGEHLTGFIKNIRPDGKINVCLHKLASEKSADVAASIIKFLEQEGGFMTVTDKSPPEEIKALFGVSKGKFKKAIGTLYKQKTISLETGGIRLHKD
ncbi:MAG: S1-like domain-containing RNA-binding protein [Mariprofundaceae bacterium]